MILMPMSLVPLLMLLWAVALAATLKEALSPYPVS